MALETILVYLYPRENAEEHKTNFYEIVHDEFPTAVLRRGKRFSLTVRFSRDYNEDIDEIRLLFKYGRQPHILQGTMGVVRIISMKILPIEDSCKEWRANILAVNEDSSLTIEVFAPTTIPVGLWRLSVETTIKNSPQLPLESESTDLYLLCNPWNCHDLVFMPEETYLDEYILKDIGKIWVGPIGTSKGREWVFGQFDACVLPAIMMMFDKSGLRESFRGDPIKLTRMISKMVNSNDDNGILVGRWDGQYDDGTAPSAWTGSVPILQEYLDNNVPVCYGQCWVFAGVVTTICRAIGIPSRVVSNLVSAHDANATLTIDKYFDENNEEAEDPLGTGDSIWNYHVWNDVYMARPDLDTGYGGWQAIDATPQETSDGFYQCGPASLEAVKQGKIGYNYDVGFIISTVNADLMHWKIDKTCATGLSKIYCNKYHIGRHILTKKPFVYDFNGDKDRDDITKYYKAKEGTEAERLSLLNTVRNASATARQFYALPDPSKEDVEFNLRDISTVKLGDNFDIIVDIRNNSDHARTIECILSAATVYYNGVRAQRIIKQGTRVSLKPQSDFSVKHLVHADQYMDKLVEYANIKISFIATVTETRQTYSDEDDFEVIKPNINIEIPDEIPINQPSKITLEFTNPLKRTLTNCIFNVSGTRLMKNQQIRCNNLAPLEALKVEVMISPKMNGLQKIVATFTSRELMAITGFAKTNVY